MAVASLNSTSLAPAQRSSSRKEALRLAVVGDIHGAWCGVLDAAALQALDADIAVFVGDCGNEDVALVQQIAGLAFPKVVILGNHDAWYTDRARRQLAQRSQQSLSSQELLDQAARQAALHPTAGNPATTAAAVSSHAHPGPKLPCSLTGPSLPHSSRTSAQQQELQALKKQQEADQGKAPGLFRPLLQCLKGPLAAAAAAAGQAVRSSSPPAASRVAGEQAVAAAPSSTPRPQQECSSQPLSAPSLTPPRVIPCQAASHAAAPEAPAQEVLYGAVLSATSGSVAAQLRALGASHLGYRSVHVEGRPYSLVGARPFSKGGGSQANLRHMLADIYPGVATFQASTDRIVQEVLDCPQGNALLLVGHNGPLGLGRQPQDPCGVDWQKDHGDHGDKDLADALKALAAAGRSPALVLFGHMHHRLHPMSRRVSEFRRMAAVDRATGTVFLNAAVVPRVAAVPTGGQARPGKSPPKRNAAPPLSAASAGAAETLRYFLTVDLVEGEVAAAAQVWVHVAAGSAPSNTPAPSSPASSTSQSPPQQGNPPGPAGQVSGLSACVAHQVELVRRVRGETGSVLCVWDASEGRFDHVVLPLPSSHAPTPAHTQAGS